MRFRRRKATSTEIHEALVETWPMVEAVLNQDEAAATTWADLAAQDAYESAAGLMVALSIVARTHYEIHANCPSPNCHFHIPRLAAAVRPVWEEALTTVANLAEMEQ